MSAQPWVICWNVSPELKRHAGTWRGTYLRTEGNARDTAASLNAEYQFVTYWAELATEEDIAAARAVGQRTSDGIAA